MKHHVDDCTVSRRHADYYSMPKKHTVGILYDGCTGYIGTGISRDDAINDGIKNEPSGFDLRDCWTETVEENHTCGCRHCK